ncbi:MAG: aminotransferase class V-fold PLP-dependent enzyme [Chloroflexota bacterium]
MSASQTLPQAPLDAAAVRRDFPILDSANERGQRLVFLDSAASSQKPESVIAAVEGYYRTANANIHRGVYELSERATAAYEQARHLAAHFINAEQARSCIFVRNTTEAINLVAQAWGRANLRPGDLVVVTEMDHHSNLVPWQIIAEQQGATVEGVPVTGDGLLDLDALDRLLAREPRVVAFPHVSNSLGTINPAAEIIRRTHAAGAIAVVDGAQSVPHVETDVQALDADFLAFSGHKMLAPMGSGVLYGKLALLEAMPPFMGGGGMIRKVEIGKSTWADVPARFEAGTPAVGDAVGLGAAIEYLGALGMERVREHERELTAVTLGALADLKGVRVFGPADPSIRAGVFSFEVDGIHPHDVAAVLDAENVAVRAGHHCCQPLMRTLGVPATTRASFYVYNGEDDVARLADAIRTAQRIFGV